MSTIADAALDYSRRGWKPVPVNRKTKKAIGKDWQNRPYDPAQFNGNSINVGIQFGTVSGGLVDVDLDSQLAIGLALEFLPRTGTIFGHKSKPCSHQFYISNLCDTEKGAAIQFRDLGDAMIVELRIGANGKGAVSIVPPSMHVTGEMVQWSHNGEPARVDGADLKRSVLELAVACLLRPHYPGQGSRHEGALVLGGVLARAGWTAGAIQHLVEVLARAAADDDVRDRVEAAVSAVSVKANGQDVAGLTRLAEVWGEDVSKRLGKWLGSNGLPESELLIDGSNLTRTAKQLAAMFAQHRRFLFNGHEPVEIVAETGNMPRAITVTPETVRVFAHEICTPVKIVKDKMIRTTLNKDIANLYLRGLQGRWGLKPFNGITTAPILASDGSFRTGSGYDEATGLWCHNIPEVQIPEQPTQAQAKAYLDALRRFFRTFAFADAQTIRDTSLDVVNPDAPIGLDESSFLVSLMTAVCRSSLTLAPGILANAPAVSGAGTGKGLATKAICIIASGAAPSAFTSGHDEGEFDKRLTAALIEARPAIFLDNYNSKDLKSDILASALTENPCEVRPMGHTVMVKLHTRTLVAMTGNDVQVAEDMARRIIKTDYDAKVEDPELRPFKSGFLDTVYKERATLLGHALTIWRWGRQNADRLTQGKPLGSYEVWAQWCRDPLINLGTRDPIDRLAAIKAADPKRKRIQSVFEAWWLAHEDRLLPAKDLDQTVIQAIDEKSGFRDGEFHYSRQFVARWLQSHTNTRVGGYVLTSTPLGPDSKPVNHFKLLHQPPNCTPAGENRTSSMPFMLTRAMKQKLRERGYSDDQIRHLTPQEAHDILEAATADLVPPLDAAAVQTLALRYVNAAYGPDGRVRDQDSLARADADLRAGLADVNVPPNRVEIEFERVLDEVATNPNPGPNPDTGPNSDN
jgi:hypothetical protein